MGVQIHFIQDSEGLDQLMAAIEAAPRIGLDTEFHAERRYRPELMLLQIATSAEEVWLLDPHAIHPAPLGALLSSSEVLLHGGQQDIRILNEVTGFEPGRILDMQIGAGLLGLHYPERLSRLAAALLELPLDKSPTLTDWSTRPLSPEQLRYAAEDASTMFPLAAALEERLQGLGRAEWAWAASAEMAAGVLAPADERTYWRGWDVASRMSTVEWHALGALREWRDALAVEQGRPPHAVLPNGILIDLARRRPTGRRGLTVNRRIHSGFIRHHGAALLKQLQNLNEAAVPPHPPTRPERDVIAALALWGRAGALDAGGAAAGCGAARGGGDGRLAVLASGRPEKIPQRRCDPGAAGWRRWDLHPVGRL
ncbi:MAG: ribonuclease D [Myxococcota bacterium]|jgi:ribonuclease D